MLNMWVGWETITSSGTGVLGLQGALRRHGSVVDGVGWGIPVLASQRVLKVRMRPHCRRQKLLALVGDYFFSSVALHKADYKSGQ